MMGPNNPMAIEKFSWKMEFQCCGACHIHGTAWCNLSEVSKIIDVDSSLTDSEDDYDNESEVDEEDLEFFQHNIEDTETILEKAFKKLWKIEKEEEKFLLSMADKFSTCTLNPENASRMIDETTTVWEREKIVDQATETQTH